LITGGGQMSTGTAKKPREGAAASHRKTSHRGPGGGGGGGENKKKKRGGNNSPEAHRRASLRSTALAERPKAPTVIASAVARWQQSTRQFESFPSASGVDRRQAVHSEKTARPRTSRSRSESRAVWNAPAARRAGRAAPAQRPGGVEPDLLATRVEKSLSHAYPIYAARVGRADSGCAGWYSTRIHNCLAARTLSNAARPGVPARPHNGERDLARTAVRTLSAYTTNSALERV